MLDAGWELASKATTDVDLTTLDPTTLEREVAGSRRVLRRRFGVPVNNFCYPLGRYDNTVISAVHRAGYVGAQTEIAGVADAAHPYIIDRIEILLSDGLSGFISKLQSAGPSRRGDPSCAGASETESGGWRPTCPGRREAAFSTRLGGVSEGPFESLNLGRLTGDLPDAVRENRHRLAAAIAIDPELVLIGRQVHGADGGAARSGSRARAPTRIQPRACRRPMGRQPRDPTWRRSSSSPTACRWRSRGPAAWR